MAEACSGAVPAHVRFDRAEYSIQEIQATVPRAAIGIQCTLSFSVSEGSQTKKEFTVRVDNTAKALGEKQRITPVTHTLAMQGLYAAPSWQQRKCSTAHLHVCLLSSWHPHQAQDMYPF